MNTHSSCSACRRNLSKATEIIERDGRVFCSRQCAEMRKVKIPRKTLFAIGTSLFLFSFKGRVARKAYWLFFIVMLTAIGGAGYVDYLSEDRLLPIAALITLAIFLWPYLALTTKRLHDRGRSGFWIVPILVPYVGPLYGIWLHIEMLLPGEFGTNHYGLDTHQNYRYQKTTSRGRRSRNLPAN